MLLLLNQACFSLFIILHICGCSAFGGPEEGDRVPGTGFAGSCEFPYVGRTI